MSKATFKRVEKFMREDSGKQFLMVNNIDMSENPEDIEGAQPGETAKSTYGSLYGTYVSRIVKEG